VFVPGKPSDNTIIIAVGIVCATLLIIVIVVVIAVLTVYKIKNRYRKFHEFQKVFKNVSYITTAECHKRTFGTDAFIASGRHLGFCRK